MVVSAPPSVVIITRHGARLDAADDSWQSNSSTPYDTPLSYGGWAQTRALGARIASLLHARDLSTEDSNTKAPPKRKPRIVIHSSPFLRCIESSIAISAGMSHFHANQARVSASNKAANGAKEKTTRQRSFSPPSRSFTMDSKDFEARFIRSSIAEALKSPSSQEGEPAIKRPILRVDACLGEWLSTDYYETITPPPPSNIMVAGAKAELIKPGEPIRGAKIVRHDGSVEVFPGASSSTQNEKEKERRGSISAAEWARNLPGHSAMSRSVDRTKGGESSAAIDDDDDDDQTIDTGYMPPIPTYALLPKAPIPAGYVAHARDECVNIDFQWDSMRDPQQWGDGGSYGEEWSSMHRRFRAGLSHMIQWYKTHGPDYDPQRGESDSNDDKAGSDACETVLVIVTHGAGCNALIGALTNQPVLMDVGMGSLTMAVRKSHPPLSPTDRSRANSNAGGGRRRSGSIDLGLSSEYDMKLVASTEHLRAGGDPLVIPQLAAGNPSMPRIPESRRTPSGSSVGAATARERGMSGSLAPASAVAGGASNASKNSAIGSMRRTSVKSKSSRAYSPSPVLTSQTSSGLWGGSGSTAEAMENMTLTPAAVGGNAAASLFDTTGEGFATSSPTGPAASGEAGSDSRSNTMQSGATSRAPAVSVSGPGLWGASTASPVDKTTGSRRSTLSSRR